MTSPTPIPLSVAQYDRVLEPLTKKLPKVVAHLQENRADVLGFTAVPKEIWINYSTLAWSQVRSLVGE